VRSLELVEEIGYTGPFALGDIHRPRPKRIVVAETVKIVSRCQ